MSTVTLKLSAREFFAGPSDNDAEGWVIISDAYWNPSLHREDRILGEFTSTGTREVRNLTTGDTLSAEIHTWGATAAVCADLLRRWTS